MPSHETAPETHEHDGASRTRLALAWSYARHALQIGIPLLVIWLVWREVHKLDLHQIRATLKQADASLAALGIAVSIFAVFIMGLYDAIAFERSEQGQLSFMRRWALGSVLFGWTNFISMGPLGGPAIRLFMFRRYGYTATEITRGLSAHYLGSAAGIVAWLISAWLPLGSGTGVFILRALIALCISVLALLLVARLAVPIMRRHRYGAELEGMPLARLGLVSFLDWGFTLLAFDLLVRSVGVSIDPSGAARTVFTGQLAGIMSMIPGGIGSADAVWFRGFGLLGVPEHSAGAAILAFRTGFYLVPWFIALIVIYMVLVSRSQRLALWQRRLVTGAVMLNAILLLLSAATPPIHDRLDVIADLVPLGAIEVSHLLAAVCAVLMLLLVRGLLRGYRSAYLLTMAMLIASALAHPLKGGDYEEAISSVVLALLLIGVRGAFTRRGRIPIGWELLFAAGLGALSLYLITGFAAFERIPYNNDLWVTFAQRADASRFLRAAIVLGVVLLIVLFRQATRPVRLWVTPSEVDIERAEAFIRANADSADPLLVGGADKGVWFFEPKPGRTDGLVLYQRHGDHLLVFKDPVLAPNANPKDLIEAFLEMGDALDVEIVFSMISSDWMGHLHDFGYHFLKVNEEAIVDLEGFSLAGGKNAAFRRNVRDMEQAGVRFEILEPPFDSATIDRLREVSDQWLASKGGHELQFSACCFSPQYIQRHPLAVAKDRDGQIVAFVNILKTRPGGAATLDFMRSAHGAPNNVMDFVLNQIMLSLTAEGYSVFSLGGAPLSDVGVVRGSRLAERMLHLFSKHSERIYNYQGLVNYKNKFHPRWEARYLAFEKPWDWASALIANARLVQASGRDDRKRISAARVGEDSVG